MSLNSYSKNGVTYFQLYISCPVCNNEGRNTPHSYWSHDVDGGDVYVGDDATYQCKQCGHTRHVSAWEYGCPRHNGCSDEYVYKKTTIASLASVISCAGQMVSETGLPWLRVFMEKLEEGWDDNAANNLCDNNFQIHKKKIELEFNIDSVVNRNDEEWSFQGVDFYYSINTEHAEGKRIKIKVRDKEMEKHLSYDDLIRCFNDSESGWAYDYDDYAIKECQIDNFLKKNWSPTGKFNIRSSRLYDLMTNGVFCGEFRIYFWEVESFSDEVMPSNSFSIYEVQYEIKRWGMLKHKYELKVLSCNKVK